MISCAIFTNDVILLLLKYTCKSVCVCTVKNNKSNIFFFLNIRSGVWLLYNAVLVSAV